MVGEGRPSTSLPLLGWIFASRAQRPARLARVDRRGLPFPAADGTGDVMRVGWVYIMTNRPDGTLYIGVTSDLLRRVWEHRNDVLEGFTKRYGLKRLVYFERHEDIQSAIVREKALKTWRRAWKVRLIVADNPNWDDLYDRLA
jgi:putative endonuclease